MAAPEIRPPYQFSVALPADLRERAQALSRRTDRSVAWLLREALRLYLESVEPLYLMDQPKGEPEAR